MQSRISIGGEPLRKLYALTGFAQAPQTSIPHMPIPTQPDNRSLSEAEKMVCARRGGFVKRGPDYWARSTAPCHMATAPGSVRTPASVKAAQIQMRRPGRLLRAFARRLTIHSRAIPKSWAGTSPPAFASIRTVQSCGRKVLPAKPWLGKLKSGLDLLC